MLGKCNIEKLALVIYMYLFFLSFVRQFVTFPSMAQATK